MFIKVVFETKNPEETSKKSEPNWTKGYKKDLTRGFYIKEDLITIKSPA